MTFYIRGPSLLPSSKPLDFLPLSSSVDRIHMVDLALQHEEEMLNRDLTMLDDFKSLDHIKINGRVIRSQ